ncbi:TMEM175 family protein [Chitinophaga sp. 212800010-3]|uniref:TMEM175 family protein n=1 Tax=unclassified Chitinophaga TaxID=2619133 RepID=UPI002DEF82DE|nr:putative membrane protein [Chitinophaga sp. 212800010-3]
MSKKIEYNQVAGQRIQRTEALSDGVFAIAMTLLVLDLKVPVSDALHSDKELLQALAAMGPKILTYFIGFMTMGIFWVGQSSQLAFIEKSERRLTWVSIFFLAFVSLVPFTTAFLSEHINSWVAIVLYWLNILVLGTLLYIHWVCAYGSGFVTVTGEEGAHLNKAILRRIVTAQLLYASGAVAGVIYPLAGVGFIFLIQLNYALGLTMLIRKLFGGKHNDNITSTPHS